MAGVRKLTSIQIRRGFGSADALLAAVQILFAFGANEDRVTGYLYGDGKTWPRSLSAFGSPILEYLSGLFGVGFTHVAYQGYRNGSGCDWHADTPWDAQAILSLGATRTFGIRPVGGESEFWPVSHGDLVFMPSGFQDTHEHCVPVEPDKPGERISLVFRTARS